ncbi:MAG: AAA family ATPase [Bacteroidota bacterium]
MQKLPIGIQSIEKILIKNTYIYVDKTPIAQQLIQGDAPHYFLSRPRRFGKSLFLNTLAEILQGNKELFKNCAIYHADYDWEPYPVLAFDFSNLDTTTNQDLKAGLTATIDQLAHDHGMTVQGPSASFKLQSLVKALAKERQVVILVDEYDWPIINNLNNPTTLQQNRESLKSFFSTLKSLDHYLKLTFTTGVSRFSKVSLFSGLNNLKDLTMHPAYSAITGYTEDELIHAFDQHIQALAQGRDMIQKQVLDEAKHWYNGYRFTRQDTYVYNPFSVLNYLDEKQPKSYCYATGTPSFLVEKLKQYPADNIPLEEMKLTESDLLDTSEVEEMDVKALMFQTGYLTLEDYDALGGLYALAFPNQEVREAFVTSLAKTFVPHVASLAQVCYQALQDLTLDPFFKTITGAISEFPYWLFSKEPDAQDRAQETSPRERTYHMILLSLLKGMGFSVAAEVANNRGRIDLLLQTPKLTYVVEVKLDRSPQEALEQIHAQAYYQPYLEKGKPVVLLGLNFSSKARNVTGWLGEVLDPEGVTLRYLSPA